MTPDTLARIHAAAFRVPRPWRAQEFRDLLASPHVFVVGNGPCFAMGRVIADEAELLTLATDPDHRRLGLARDCLTDFDHEAANRGATSAFLEVAADNHAARTLYGRQGWQDTGVRPRYYRGADGAQIDAQIMGNPLP